MSPTSKSRLGWTLLILLGTLLLSSSVVFTFAMWQRSTLLILVAYIAMANCLILFGICLALIDLSPIKRIVLFSILPSVVFSCIAYACLWITENFPIAPITWGQFYRLPQFGLFASMSIASILWLVRIHRGLLISRTKVDERKYVIPPRTPEAISLVTWIALASVPLFFSNYMRTGILGSFAAFSAFGALIVLPVTCLMMRTRRPIIAGLSLSTGVPLAVLVTFVSLQISRYSDSGILVSQEAELAITACFIFLFCLTIFFWGLRLIGFRMLVPHLPLQRPKATASAPGRHALDD